MDHPCHLLRLPRELRDMIFSNVFEGSRLRYGLSYENPEWVDRNAQQHQPLRNGDDQAREDWVLQEKTYRNIRPAPNTLALLRVCRQIHAETVSLFPRKILFTFDTLETMLDKLSTVPSEIVSNIRNIQVSPAHTGVKRYPLASMLKVIPQLNLDTLTVVMNYASRARQKCPDNIYVIDELIRYGVGWRKLYFITADSLLLTSLRFDLDGMETRPAQPTQWNQAMIGRDYENAAAPEQPVVRIYRGTDSKSGAVLEPSRRKPFTHGTDEHPPDWLTIEDRIERKAARAEHAEQLREAQRGDKAREIMVVVERRRGIDVMDRSEEPYSVNTDFRAWMGGKRWNQYWRALPNLQAKLDEDDRIDEYDNPMHYEWVASERKGVTWPVKPPVLQM